MCEQIINNHIGNYLSESIMRNYDVLSTTHIPNEIIVMYHEL